MATVVNIKLSTYKYQNPAHFKAYLICNILLERLPDFFSSPLHYLSFFKISWHVLLMTKQCLNPEHALEPWMSYQNLDCWAPPPWFLIQMF